jgi:hypothetical protein
VVRGAATAVSLLELINPLASWFVAVIAAGPVLVELINPLAPRFVANPTEARISATDATPRRTAVIICIVIFCVVESVVCVVREGLSWKGVDVSEVGQRWG